MHRFPSFDVSLRLALIVLTVAFTVGCSVLDLTPPRPPEEIEFAPPDEVEAQVLVESIELIQDESSSEVRISSVGQPSFSQSTDQNGDLVIELTDVELAPIVRSLESGYGLVSMVRVFPGEETSTGSSDAKQVRLQIESREPTSHNVVLDGDRIRVFLAPNSGDEPETFAELEPRSSEPVSDRVVSEAIPVASGETPEPRPVPAEVPEPAEVRAEPEVGATEEPREVVIGQPSDRPAEEASEEYAEATIAALEDAPLLEEESPSLDTFSEQASAQEEDPTQVEAPEVESESTLERAPVELPASSASQATIAQLSPAELMRAAANVELGTASDPTLSPALTDRRATRLLSVDIQPLGADALFRIVGDGELEYSTFMLPHPSRFVVDLHGVLEAEDIQPLPSGSGAVQQVRVGQFKPEPEPVTRVVFDMRDEGVPLIERDDRGLSIRFAPRPRADQTARGTRVAGSNTPDRSTGSLAEGAPVAVESPEGFRVIRRHSEAVNRRDLTAMLANVTDDVEWFSVTGSDTVLISRGREGFMMAMKNRFDTRDSQVAIEEVVENGRFITVRERVTWLDLQGDEASEVALGVFEIEDGKIRRFWSYPPE